MRHAFVALLVAHSMTMWKLPVHASDDDGLVEVMSAAVGEVLALGDLCEWNFVPKIERLYLDAAKTPHMTSAQQNELRGKVAVARQSTFGHLSGTGRARMRADICKPEERARLEGIIAGISFD